MLNNFLREGRTLVPPGWQKGPHPIRFHHGRALLRPGCEAQMCVRLKHSLRALFSCSELRRMRRVNFITYAGEPSISADDLPLARELEERGFAVRACPWDGVDQHYSD